MGKLARRIAAGTALLAVLGFMGLGVFLSQGKVMQDAHLPSAFAEPFDFDNGSFDEYIAWSQRRIRAGRTEEPGDAVLSNLSPFQLEPDSDCPVNPDGRYGDGLILVHGLIASPYSMRALGEYFRDICFPVLGVLLDGHGTRPGDMLASTWEDWHRHVAFATRVLAEKVERVYLSGHSVGGTLAILEGAVNPAVDALILFAPALQVDEASKYAGAVSQVGRFFPPAAWFELEPEDAVYRYESFPFTAAAETWALIRETQARLADNPLTIPVMTVASAQDTTVAVQATFDFMQSLANPLSFTLLYAQHELPPYERTRVVDSSLPEAGILSVGHLGLMTPPEHPWYGRDQAYRYCGHYYGQDNDLFARCKAGERDFYGEVTGENLGLGVIERIAFNPFYNGLLDEIDLFIEQVSMDRRGVPLNPGLEVPRRLDLDN